MPKEPKPQINPMFPTKGSLKEVKDTANSQLPIVTASELNTVLEMQKNTVIKLIDDN